jgi:prepilin-type N-terminal cleavage/methylation domain-containing protein
MTKTLKKGFTLVELIVVIAIIAILATVSVVGYSAFIKNANQSKVNQELAQVENLLMAEAIEGIVTDLKHNEETIGSISMTLEETTLAFKVFKVTNEAGSTPTKIVLTEEELIELQAYFKALLKAAGVDESMRDNMTLFSVPSDYEVPYELPEDSYIIRYQIDTEYSDIIVKVELFTVKPAETES